MFDLNMPTGIRALAVLAGGNHGRILTDAPARPRWCFVQEADDGTLYRGGDYSADFLFEAVNLLRQDGIVALAFRDGDTDFARFPPDPTAGATCLEFERPLGASDLSPFLRGLPNGFSIHRMDVSLLEKSPEREENINRYGSLDNLLARGIAVCILRGNETVCEAYANMEIMGVREIGITTQEAYRRQGFAAIACAHLIQMCEKAGSQTYWDCVKLNHGSARLARKLGFRNERAYRLLAWFKPKEDPATV
jgi:GNAT superfamily N-acetyltransferase